MTRSIWILNEKGGTGKTTTACAVVDYLLHAGAKCHIIDADTQPGQKERSSLSAFFQTADRIDIGVDPDELMSKPSLAVSHWDRLFETAVQSDTLVDFGANVASSVLFWVENSEIGQALSDNDIQLDLIIVTTANSDSIRDALDLTRRLCSAIPKSSRRVCVALNCADGDFDSYEDTPELDAFRQLVESGDAVMTFVPHCGSEIWRDIDRHRITAFGASQMPAEDLAKILKTRPLETTRGRKALAKWHKEVISDFILADILEDA